MKTRMYVLVNSYMMGIQAGIQAAHAAANLVGHYGFAYADRYDDRYNLVDQWQSKDQTMILLNGGYQSKMLNFAEGFLAPNIEKIPYAFFCEENDSLNGALTAIAFILPQHLWDVKLVDGRCPLFSDTIDHKYTQKEMDFIEAFKSFKLKQG
ncbi:hypothetical protein A54_146 [Septuagintavirus sv54]|uniref:Uncharacterized protein n=1 Tax=Escherichia phage A5-4 TaxID=2996162 RepID=A0AAE9PWD6_9CAUD|nr:hypothetical protein A54_146 [Escherichia phage A5-4]